MERKNTDKRLSPPEKELDYHEFNEDVNNCEENTSSDDEIKVLKIIGPPPKKHASFKEMKDVRQVIYDQTRPFYHSKPVYDTVHKDKVREWEKECGRGWPTVHIERKDRGKYFSPHEKELDYHEFNDHMNTEVNASSDDEIDIPKRVFYPTKKRTSLNEMMKTKEKGPLELPAMENRIQPYIETLLDSVKVPVVGLNFICEVQHSGPVTDFEYKCHLCRKCYRGSRIIQHITSYGHQKEFLKVTDYRSYKKLKRSNISSKRRKQLLIEEVHSLEMRDGRGNVKVRVKTSKSMEGSHDLHARSENLHLDNYSNMPSNYYTSAVHGLYPIEQLVNETSTENKITSEEEVIVMMTLNHLIKSLCQYEAASTNKTHEAVSENNR